MRTRGRTTGILMLVLLSTGCATTTTQLGSVDPSVVRAEEARQRELALATMEEHQLRIEQIAYPILTGGAPLCDPEPYHGFRFGTDHGYNSEWIPAAHSVLRLGDTLSVVGVTPGSPAAEAGLLAGDRIVGAGPLTVADLTGKNAGKRFAEFHDTQIAAGEGRLDLRIVRDGSLESLTIDGVAACPYAVVVTQDGTINAFADGEAIYVTTGMMRFAEDDELAVVLGHEMAHNAMGHIDAKKQNALAGGLLGLVADIALASQGINTGGAYTNQFAQLGAMTFSQDFEREADYVGLYALALAGYPLDEAPTFWRHMAIANPGSIQLATSHPTTAERFVRLEQVLEEIREKQEAGSELRPEMKKDSGTEDP